MNASSRAIRIAAWAGLVFAALLVGVGCSAEVTSPPLTSTDGKAGGVEPDLACTKQLETRVVLKGSGFTPQPTNVLDGPAELVLPKIELLPATTLEGAPASGAPIVIPDDGDLVRYKDDTEMSFALLESLGVPSGVYDVRVTNPDGVHAAVFARSFAAVPPPELTSFDAPENALVCLAEAEQERTIVGSGFLKVGSALPTVRIGELEIPAKVLGGCTPIEGDLAEPIERCSELTFVLAKDSLPVGVHNVGVRNPGTAACTTPTGLKLVAVPPPTLVSFEPPEEELFCLDDAVQVRTLVGVGFIRLGDALPTVLVGDQELPADSLGGCLPDPIVETVEHCTSLSFTLPKGALEPGAHELRVRNPAPVACTSNPSALTALPPPTVTGFESPNDALVCVAEEGQTRRLVGEGFVDLPGALPSVRVGAQTFPADSLESCTPDPDLGGVETCTILVFTMPNGSLEPGEYDVVVENTLSADCRSIAPIKMLVVPPPRIDSLAPGAVCDTTSAQTISIAGGDFLVVDGVQPTVTLDATPLTPVTGQGCTPVGEGYLVNVQVCTSVETTVPANTLIPSKNYSVSVTNPEPVACTTAANVQFKVVPPPTVDSVIPATICAGGGAVAITGSGFYDPVSVDLEPQGGGATLTSITAECSSAGVPECVEFPGDKVVATFGAGAMPGTTYDVVVRSGGGCTDPEPHKTVTAIEGPILFFVDPYLVSDKVNTRITLFATALYQPLPDVPVWITPAGQTAPVTPLATLPIDANLPRRLQATVPKGQPPGTYDVHLKDGSGCSVSVLEKGLVVAAEEKLTIGSVEPPFGDDDAETAVTIFRDTSAPAPANAPFKSTPRVYLNPAQSTNPPASAIAIALSGVTLVDEDTLTAVVPGDKKVPTGKYDVIVVNPEPTAEVGILLDGYTSLADPPPVVANVTPQSMAAASGQNLTVTGDDFRAGATARLFCETSAGASVVLIPTTTGAPTCDASGNACTMEITVDASSLTAGSVCVVRITNSDGSYGDFSAVGVTNSSLNLGVPKPGTPMKVARRGLVSAAAQANSASRFVYAIGGDDGGATVFGSVEAAPIDLFGEMGEWSLQWNSLLTKRVFAGAAVSGRYVYVGGGSSDGSTPLASVERALVLSPSETPTITDIDVELGDAGLGEGQWIYRVSAIFSPDDTDNPGGESLASDEFVIKLPSITGKKISVILSWTPPKDSLGANVPNVAGYRVYRTKAAGDVSGTSVLLAEINDPATLAYTDDGTDVPGTDTPLPLGSTGKWAALPAMASARNGVAYAIAPDPVNPTTTLYLYAIFGRTAASALGTYEFLPITVAPNGRQTVAPAWVAGTATATPRWRHGVWVADRSIEAAIGQAPNDPDTTFLYAGGGNGTTAGPLVTDVDRARVTAGGQLDGFTPTEPLKGGGAAGYGVLAAAEQLHLFGGAGGLPSTKGVSALIVNGAGDLASNSWNAGQSLSTARVFMGSSVQSAFAFFLGGQTTGGVVTSSTEFVIW